MKMRTQTLLFILTALLTGCFSQDKPLAQVGNHTITAHDADYRNQVISFYYPEEKRQLGLDQLIRAYRTAEILANNGHAITPEVIENEVKRIDTQTRDPAGLAKIKAIFGEDQAAYRKIFVVPVYAERMIYFSFFLYHPEIQAPSGNAPKVPGSNSQRRSHVREYCQGNRQGPHSVFSPRRGNGGIRFKD